MIGSSNAHNSNEQSSKMQKHATSSSIHGAVHSPSDCPHCPDNPDSSWFFPTLVQIASKQRMGRNRLYSKAWRCELRLGHKDGGHFFAGLEILHKLDAVMRRASSVAKFAIRFEAVSERRELLLRIAAVRHEATDRADSAVIPILRFFPNLEKGILAAFVRRVSYAGVHEL